MNLDNVIRGDFDKTAPFNKPEAEPEFDYHNIENIEFGGDGLDHIDYPKYRNVYIAYATWNGRELTEDEIDVVNDDSQFVYEKLMEKLF